VSDRQLSTLHRSVSSVLSIDHGSSIDHWLAAMSPVDHQPASMSAIEHWGRTTRSKS